MRRSLALLVTAALTAAVAALLPPVATPAAAATPALALTVTAPGASGPAGSGTLLAGNPGTVAFSASNSSATPEYNVSFRIVLPAGVTYRSGSTTPSDIGDPTIYTNAGAQTLVWSDAFDLQANETNGISFDVVAAPASYPVGSTFTPTADAVYGSSAPRTVPKFDTTGVPVVNAAVTGAAGNTPTTTIAAIAVSKSEPSPENNLLRGVHDHPTVYSIKVTNNATAATDGVSVTDYLPAEQEFLGCGGVDNSSAPEYAGAPSLTGTPVIAAPTPADTAPVGCPTPTSVTTVTDPAGYPAGVYTKVVWGIGSLRVGEVFTIRYAAGIPLRKNVDSLAAAADPTANLDNNTGAPTRQSGSPATSTNYVHASGSYTGAFSGTATNPVTADGSKQVTVHDVRIYKSVSPTTFASGAIAKYTLTIDASEYEDASAIQVVDTMPDGVCPIDASTNHVTGAPAECDPVTGDDPSQPYTAGQNSNGTFTLTFAPIASVPADGTRTITYYGRMRTVYTASNAALGLTGGEPTSAGDSFTNSAVQTSTTTPVPANPVDSGTTSVTDPTSATQRTGGPTLTKQIAERTTTMNCAAAGNTWDGSAQTDLTKLTFVKGDRICFRITVAFSGNADARDAVLTDFLPDNTTYEAGSMSFTGLTAGEVGFDDGGTTNPGALTWTLGHSTGAGHKEVTRGTTFQAVFSAITTGAAQSSTADKLGNLAKLREVDSKGAATSLRDGVNFAVAPAPVSIAKGVASVNSTTYATPGDGKSVKEGDAVGFEIDVTNNSTTPAVPVDSVQVWDVLPRGLTCAAVSSISDSGACHAANSGLTFTGSTTSAAIVWTGTGAGALTIAAGAKHAYTYTVTVPAGTEAGDDLTDTAYVRSYDAVVDTGTTSTAPYYPASNVDTSVPAASQDALPAKDASDVKLSGVTVTKGVASAIKETNNAGQETQPGASTTAVPGESMTFTLTATIPAGTSVYGAKYTDNVPAGLTVDSATGDFAADATAPVYGALPGGVTLATSGQGVTLSFPAGVYDNTTATNQVFRVQITAHADAGNTSVVKNTASLSNTAKFTTANDPAAQNPTATTSAAKVTIAEPAPTLSKSNDHSTGTVTGGTVVTYTLVAGDTTGRPPLHDAWVVDCLPGQLQYTALVSATAGTVTTKAGGNAASDYQGCKTGYTEIDWNIGDIAPGATATLKYTATVQSATRASAVLTNVAAISGDSLAGTRSGPASTGSALGRLYTPTGVQSSIHAAEATVTKTVTPTNPTIGDTLHYTTTITVPANITLDNLAIIDTLPAGIDPASVSFGTAGCTDSSATACGLTSYSPLSASGQKVGVTFGDVTSASLARTITLPYTARVADVPAAKAGASLTNSVVGAWDTSPAFPPTSAGDNFDQHSGTPGTATVVVREPKLSLVKSASTHSPQPGQSIGYTLALSNAADTAPVSTVSPAYSITVTDSVPTGVVVDPSSISDGGTLSGAGTDGGGTITWTITGPLAPGTSFAGDFSDGLHYAARLATSADIDATALVNHAAADYYSEPHGSFPGARHYTDAKDQATVTPIFPALSASKSASAALAYLHDSYTWTVTVTNAAGSGTAYHVGATDTLPANWSYDAHSAQVSVDNGPATQVDPSTIDAATGKLTWTDLATLAGGHQLTITYTATPGDGVTSVPGIGHSADQTNAATAIGQDNTGASRNKTGSYAGPQATATTHIDSADVSLDKKAGVQPVAGGRNGTWVLTVSNNGPDPAVGPFSVTDPFVDSPPTGVSIVSVAGTGWTCDGIPMTCRRNDSLASGSSFDPITITYQVDADVADGRTLSNSAKVTEHTYDPAPDDNTASATATVGTLADLGIDKQLTGGPIVAGQPAGYAVTVHNYGPSISRGPITVTDTLPDGTTLVSTAGSGWTCPDHTTAGAIACTSAADVPVGADAPQLQVTIAVPADRTATVTNAATVTGTTPEPSPDVHSDTAATHDDPTFSADLSIAKTLTDTKIVAGGSAHYRIRVHNAGPSDARSVVVTDTLPALLGYDSVENGSDWTCTPTPRDGTGHQVVSCALAGPLAAGGDSSFTIVTTVGQQFQGSVTNPAHVTSDTADPDPGNNDASADSDVTDEADLSISKTHTGDVAAGNTVDYTLQVTNHGSSDEHGAVTVTDPVPDGMSYVSSSGTGWDCHLDSGTVTCTGATDLADGATAADLTITLRVDPATPAGVITNTAHVAGTTDSPDPNPANDDTSDPTTIVVDTDVSLTKTLDTATPVVAGTDAQFTLTASNNGPSDATGVTVTDTLPTHLSFVSATGTGWTCGNSGQTITCTRDTLLADPPADATPGITVVAHVDPATPITPADGTTTEQNVASIATSTPGTPHQPDPVDVPIVGHADLSLTKSAVDPQATAGQTVTWSFDIANGGPSDAAGDITVVDTLPPYERYSAVGGADWTCDPGAVPADITDPQTVTCTLAHGIAHDAHDTALRITATVDHAARPGTETNTATVASPTPDPTPGNDTGTADVTIVTAPT